MVRVSLLISVFLLIQIELSGQCLNGPTVTLSAANGSTCGVTPVTVTGNTFGGIATKVTITEDGAGSVTQVSATISPFTFTYTPKNGDSGKKVIITVTTDNPLGSHCTAAKATYTLIIDANLSAPVVGTITRPTCAVETGSVVMSGLPSTGTWTLTRSPDAITTRGAGTSITISDLLAGTYNYTVTSSSGCTSSASSNVIIPAQPVSPASPEQTIDCALGYGKAVIKVTSPIGSDLTYSLDGGAYQGVTSFSNVANGSHTLTVKNSSGCTKTGASFPVSCGCDNPPTVTLGSSSGSTCGTTSITVSGNTFGGSATSVTITGNGAGTVSPALSGSSPFIFTYTPAAGDAGKAVIITVTTNDPLGLPCSAATSIFTIIVNAIPSAPLVGVITPPTCILASGSTELNGLPGTGIWILTRNPGSVTSSGTGTTITLSGLPTGLYNYTVTNGAGCISGMSANVIIPAQPLVPSPPMIGAITQPDSGLPTGSVVLNGLPVNGSWTLILTPGNLTTTGTGITKTISGLTRGTYSFTVTNSSGCTSVSSADFGIYTSSDAPVVVITNPAPVCFPSTVDLTDPKVTEGSDLYLTYTYWADIAATIQYRTPGASTAGTYYIKGATIDGFYTVRPVTVLVYRVPLANAGTDQILAYLFETNMNAELTNNYETGVWSVISGKGEFFDSTYAKTSINGLSTAKNIFLWTVTNGVCPSSSDTVMIIVHDLVITTLITPNMDGKNDYFIIKGSDVLGRIELVIFDRRGVRVYKNDNYNNLWNGVDYNEKPLPDDTYFYVIKTEKGKSVSGYVVIRR
jgi:gliding motility-associated-like protein